MTFDPNSQDKLTQYFLEEVTELLDRIEQNLYGLLEEKTIDKVHTLMRSAHTLKGSAANMELDTIETIAHHLEDVFQSLYAEELQIDAELGSLLIEGYNCLREPLTAIISGVDYDKTAILDHTATVFASLQDKLGDFFGREAPIPSSEELGFDVVGSLFEDSIPQELQEFEQIIGTQDTSQISEKINYLGEFLQNIGLSYNLPGLVSIAHTSISALERNPQDVLVVAIAVLENFYQAQRDIASGDRTVGGQVSPQLQELAGSIEQEAETTTTEAETNTTQEEAPEIPEYLAMAENEIAESSAVIESLEESISEVTSSQKTTPEDDSAEEAEEESDSQIFAALFDNNHHSKATMPEVLEPSTAMGQISPMDRILKSIWVAEPEQKVEFIPTTTKSSSLKNAESTNTIRVAVEQLNNLAHAVGELLIDENLQTLQAEQIHNSTRQTLQQYRSCQKQLNKIYDWWDKQFLRSRHRHRASRKYLQESVGESANKIKSQHFDPLEMDVYSDLHILLQSFNETITQLGEQIENIEKFASESRFNVVKRKQALSQAQENLLQARMVSLGVVLERFPRMLQQIVKSHKKPAQLELKGTEIFIDKAISDKLYDPLLHLVRNAYDHGLEDSETRLKHNKSETGTISIRAYNQGNRTIIEIEDDGGGINWQRIRQTAVEKRILSSLEAEGASEIELAEVLFQSGFSTAESISDLSGRGVGLDVVRNQIENLGGHISLQSKVGKGTKFTLQLPLNLTTSRLLICQSQQILYGILSDTIMKIIVPESEQITTQASAIGNGYQTFLRWQKDGHETLIPIVNLADCIIYQYPLPERQTNSALKTFPIKKAYRVPPLLLLDNEGELVCLRVDEIIVEQELVIKSLGGITDLPDYIQGYTVLGDGNFTLVIEPDKLLHRNWQQIANYNHHPEVTINVLPASSNLPQKTLPVDNKTVKSSSRHKLMVIEDSIVQRHNLVMTLEKANYQVIEAGNGKEALEQWQQNKDIKLIICDVEMPQMNGFEFLDQRRKNSNLSQIPVIMLTTRSSNKHRQIAFSLGANQYHTKPFSDSELINTISELIERSHSLVIS